MAKTVTKRADTVMDANPATAGSNRQTRPDYFGPYNYGGIGIVPRRGWDASTAALINLAAEKGVNGLATWLLTSPARLLNVLLDVHPMASKARSNDTTLAFGANDTHIVAVENVTLSDGTVSQQVNLEGTTALDALWSSLPAWVGGVPGIQTECFDWICSAGMAVVEGVPGKSGQGLVNVVTADPLTFRWRDTNAGRVLEQNQVTGWAAMDQNTVLASPWRGSNDNPYGRPLRAPALIEMLRDLSNQRRLDDILHALAWPKIVTGFPLNETIKFAVDNPEVLIGQADDDGDLTPVQFAFRQMQRFNEKLTTIVHDDILSLFKDSAVTTITPGDGLSKLDSTLLMHRHRVIMSLDQLPTLMGTTTGGTLAYSSTEWRMYAEKLEFLRWFINSILVRIANLHLRLLGMPFTARADVEKIRTSDRLADEQARGLQIANEMNIVKAGLQTIEDASIALTGHGPADPERAQKALDASVAPVTPAPNDEKDDPSADEGDEDKG
jgi:hypothetical protein